MNITVDKIFLMISLGIMFVGIINLIPQMYKLIYIDAEARNLKHPKLWALFSMSGEGGTPLLLYLIGRRRYPIEELSQVKRVEMEQRKKKAKISFGFFLLGVILMIGTFAFFDF